MSSSVGEKSRARGIDTDECCLGDRRGLALVPSVKSMTALVAEREEDASGVTGRREGLLPDVRDDEACLGGGGDMGMMSGDEAGVSSLAMVRTQRAERACSDREHE